jgi:shikimate kinase
MKRGALIIIVGPKYSGKTCAGKALARLWEKVRPPEAAVFIDLDELVEEREGKSPRLLYREGPEVFRGAEAEALRALLEGPLGQRTAGDPKKGSQTITIAAGGGGLADNQEALDLLKNSPAALVYLVYIEVPAETAWKRIRAEADRTGELPPFLDTENPRETHRLIHQRRAKIYRELAALTVQAGNTPEETARSLFVKIGIPYL